jgi:hypothetical protein
MCVPSNLSWSYIAYFSVTTKAIELFNHKSSHGVVTTQKHTRQTIQVFNVLLSVFPFFPSPSMSAGPQPSTFSFLIPQLLDPMDQMFFFESVNQSFQTFLNCTVLRCTQELGVFIRHFGHEARDLQADDFFCLGGADLNQTGVVILRV